MSEERFLFQAAKISGFGFTRYDVHGQLQYLGRSLPYLPFEEARDQLIRTAGMAGADPWAIPERLCGRSIREAICIARDLNLRPHGRTSSKLAKTLLEVATSLTPENLKEVAVTLAEMAKTLPDLSPDPAEDSDDIWGFLDE